MSIKDAVIIDYTNYRGERRKRVIIPHGLIFGSTDWHPKPQWLLSAEDVEKEEIRHFAMKDIHSWEAATKAKVEELES